MLVGSVTHPEEIEEVGPLVDLVEIRLDHFSIEKKPPYPCIFTFRKKAQGGARDLPESERLKLIEKYLELQPEYCDLEADTDPAFIEKMARKFPKTKWIGSLHNFEETPRDLNKLLRQMEHPRFSIYKLALKANCTADMLRLMIFATQAKAPLSVISLGECGRPSRVLGPIVGSLLNYAGLKEEPTLHRYSLKTLLELFHYRKLGPDTRIYALIGDPIDHSPGELFHNPRFRDVYVKMPLRGVEVKEFFSLIRHLPFGGLSVTVPIKEVVYAEMDELTPIAKAIGAVNTVTFKNGQKIGTNTDAPGALNALEKHRPVQGQRIALLGAGGTARAIAYEAKRRGAIVTLFNRSLSRAEAIGEAHLLSELPKHPYDILINTIPPQSIEAPPLLPGKLVMDVVYHPKETPLLAKAKELGCTCVYGEEMFVEQALLQQKEWHE